MRPVACKYEWNLHWRPIESVWALDSIYKFCRRSPRSISIDNRLCNRFINLGTPIFSLNHSGASAATVFTILTAFGIAHAPSYTRAERATQSAVRVGSSLFDFLTVPSTHYVPKIIFTFSPICRACKHSIAIYLIIMRDFIIFSASARTSNPPLSLLVGCDSNGMQRNQPCDCAMTWTFHVHQIICRIKIS